MEKGDENGKPEHYFPEATLLDLIIYSCWNYGIIVAKQSVIR